MSKTIGNALDRAIGVFAPRIAARRVQARGALAIAEGYHGGRMDRSALRNWRPGAGSANADTSWDRTDLRARSRDLARNNPTACAAINTNVSNVIGTGLSMRPRIDADALGLDDQQAEEYESAIEREWKLWAHSQNCDVARTLDFYGLQEQAFRGVLESGDIFGLLPSVERKGWPYTLAVQLIEADRISNPGRAADSERIVGGVEFDDYGAPKQYHISNKHPGDLRQAGMTWAAYPAFGANTGRRNVIHLFEQLRPMQARGVPFLSPVIEPLKQLGTYTDAELQAAVISGAFAVFIKMDPDAFTELFSEDQQTAVINSASKWDGNLSSGKAVNLLPGEEVSAAQPGRPNSQFDPFVTAIFQQIGMALEIPFEVLTMHYTASYSAARAALLTAWRVFYKRRNFMASRFCQPIYEEVLAEAVGMGRLALPGFFADPLIHQAWCGAEWAGDGPGSIDPLKEVNAAQARVDMGISTLDNESVRYDGIDWETKHRQQVKEKEARQEGGLGILPAPAAPGAPADPNIDPITGEPLDPGTGNGAVLEEIIERMDALGNRFEAIDIQVPRHPDASSAGMMSELTSMAGSIAALAAREPPTPRFEFHAGDTHIAAPEVHNHIAPAAVHQDIHIPQAPVTPVENYFDVIMPTEAVSQNNDAVRKIEIVNMPDKIIKSMPARKTTSKVERDARGEIDSTVQTEKDA